MTSIFLPEEAGSRQKVESILRDFAEEKIRQKEEERRLYRPRKNRRSLYVTMAWLACAAVWVVPSFVGVDAAPPSERVLEKGQRTLLYLTGMTLRSYRTEHGRLPNALGDAGVDDTSMVYIMRSDTAFELSSVLNGRVISFRSSADPAQFLGTAIPSVKGR